MVCYCMERNFAHGQQHGIQRGWYRDVQLMYEKNYINGIEQN